MRQRREKEKGVKGEREWGRGRGVGKVENYSVCLLPSRQWYGGRDRTGECRRRRLTTLYSRSNKVGADSDERRWARDGHGSEEKDWCLFPLLLFFLAPSFC